MYIYIYQKLKGHQNLTNNKPSRVDKGDTGRWWSKMEVRVNYGGETNKDRREAVVAKGVSNNSSRVTGSARSRRCVFSSGGRLSYDGI